MGHSPRPCCFYVCMFWTAIAGFPAAARADEARPNLIVVMVDDMGYEGVSCFGNPYFKTPQIDRLANEGMRLLDFHSSGAVCSPTRTGLLTGRYQQRAGIEAVIHPRADHPEHRKGLQLSEVTFAERLAAAGYVTGLIGKWHQGYPQNSQNYHPQNHGFHEFAGYHSGNIDFVSHVGDHNRHDWWHGRQETRVEGYSTHLINQLAVDFVRRHAGKQPFCLYVAHEAIHNPVQVPGDPVRRTEEKWDRWKWRDVSPAERIEKYKGMTLPIDEGVGALRSTVEELGIAENTLILFFSDNGPAGDFPSGSPKLRGGKGSVYEGGHKAPAVAWWPGKIRAGSESDQPMITLDVMPTLLRSAGLPLESSAQEGKPLDGVDLTPVLLREASLESRPLYWAALSNSGRRAEAMRSGPWKLVVQHPQAAPGTFENPRVELFHLQNDPGEERDLARRYPQRAATMAADLKAWYAETQQESTPQPGGWLANEATNSDLLGRKAPPSQGLEAHDLLGRKAPPSQGLEAHDLLGRKARPSQGLEAHDLLGRKARPSQGLIQSITKRVLHRNRDGKSVTWFHPRACMIPNEAAKAPSGRSVLMTLQEISGSDYFGPVHWMESLDDGATWSKPQSIPGLGRAPMPGHPGLEAGVCDVTPQHHPPTGAVLALGHVVFYRGPRFARGDQLPRYPVYVVRRADGTWTDRKTLAWNDPRGSFIYTNNCGQRVVMPNGDIMMSFAFGPKSAGRSVAGVRCSFDGETLKVMEVGPPLTSDKGRGLLEPSLVHFQDKFYLTIRAEDGRGYVAVSQNGLNYKMQPWAWDDGELLEMSSTQQHWLAHSGGLHLVYTRKDASNRNVIRWRSPLWIAQVDIKRRCLIRSTERAVLPLMGNGVDQPDAVALMGNFATLNVNPNESWVTVGEWLPRRGAVGDLLMSRILWTTPNQLAR